MEKAEHRAWPLAEVTRRLSAKPENRSTLLLACERLIALGAAGPAVTAWNRLELSEKLDAGAGRSLTNAFFKEGPALGFNWRRYTNPGVEIRPASTGLDIEFSGDQNQHVCMLEQILPVLGGRTYRLSIQSEGREMSTTDGLSWLMQCFPSRAPVASASVIATKQTTTSMTATIPSGCALASAMLVYNRKPGTTRITGVLHLDSANLELLP
jgi:hypothetical protein